MADPEITGSRDPDIVAELDAWLDREATTLKHYPADDVDTGLVQRARDEIVALRERDKPTWDPDRDEIVRLRAALERHNLNAVAVRDKALEEAIQAIDNISWDWPSPRIEDAEAFKVAIRALRTKPW